MAFFLLSNAVRFGESAIAWPSGTEIKVFIAQIAQEKSKFPGICPENSSRMRTINQAGDITLIRLCICCDGDHEQITPFRFDVSEETAFNWADEQNEND